MTTDYVSLRKENEIKYGTDIGRIGPMLLADRYADKTHFIFELLQNTEDALARRLLSNGKQSVRFNLSNDRLTISHFGKPFDRSDVKGICGIGESTKSLTDIGRFGIGFKSVYTFTDRPEIHSGDEDFAIESYVWPVAAQKIECTSGETVIHIPFKEGGTSGHDEVLSGLKGLGGTALLFLRQIDEIEWDDEISGSKGIYVRETKDLEEDVRIVTILGQEEGHADTYEKWLIFSKPVLQGQESPTRYVEIAFSLKVGPTEQKESIQRVGTSPLSVFFPTILETHLGFRIQGPYRTTPSRDNVPPRDPWNVKLVQDTATLLLDALGALKTRNLLDVAALQCLPLERAKYPEGSMFAPLFDTVLDAFASQALLPRVAGGWVAARNARLARTQELRELFDAKQLAALLNAPKEVHWLSGDITRDTAATLRNYLLYESKVPELTPELILPRLTKQFLEVQPDEWILKLYEFLAGQPALMRQGRASEIPLVRVGGGTHVVAESNGQPQAFLPSEIRTDFPTVPKSVCNTAKALEFLKALGLTEPDAVDDVVRNVIPKYMRETVDVDGEEYDADIKRILNAFGTQHRGQRDKLITALKGASFVMSVDAGDCSQYVSKPDNVYLATERLKKLFAEVYGVVLVDDSYTCLKGDAVRELLEACGALRYLRPMPDSTLSWDDRSRLRVQVGHPNTSGLNDRVNDYDLLGLKALLKALPTLAAEERRTKARLLWEELANLEERRGKGIFTGEYTWTHYGSYQATFNAAFLRELNETAWVPDHNGDLQRPELTLFDSLGWQANPFLLSKIHFKPPILDQLAKEAGIEPGVLDLLKKLGVTNESELRARLIIKEEDQEAEEKIAAPEADVKKFLEGFPEPNPPPPGGIPNEKHLPIDTTAPGILKPGPGNLHARQFISYIGVHHSETEPDPDGLDQELRMALEEKAIVFIQELEPTLERTPKNNPGYDLIEKDETGQAIKWVEVKAMSGCLKDRSVGMSHTQFECAQTYRDAFWLYIVEHAGTSEARIICVQNPAGRSSSFTFDHGWLSIADIKLGHKYQ